MINGTTTKIGTMGRIGSAQALRRRALMLLPHRISVALHTSSGIIDTIANERTDSYDRNA